VINNLVIDLGVNLPGCEVILRMREDMIRMQERFDRILGALAEELKARSRLPKTLPRTSDHQLTLRE